MTTEVVKQVTKTDEVNNIVYNYSHKEGEVPTVINASWSSEGEYASVSKQVGSNAFSVNYSSSVVPAEIETMKTVIDAEINSFSV